MEIQEKLNVAAVFLLYLTRVFKTRRMRLENFNFMP